MNIDIFNFTPLFDKLFQFFDFFGQFANLEWQSITDFIKNGEPIIIETTSLWGFDNITFSLTGEEWLLQILLAPFDALVTLLNGFLGNDISILPIYQVLILSLVPLSLFFFFVVMIKRILS